MAKAATLSADLVDTTKPLPTRQLAVTKNTKAESDSPNNALVQVRCPEAKRRAIRAAAVAEDMKINEFMLWLFDQYEQRKKASVHAPSLE